MTGTASRSGSRRTNVALLVFLLGAFATGVLAFGTGTVWTAKLIAVAHGALGLGLLLLVPWKTITVRRSLRRSGRLSGHGTSVALTLTLLVAVVAGTLHAVGGYHPVLGFTALSVHVGAAVLAAPLLVLHAWGRRQRLRRADATRRTLVRSAALGLGSLAAYATVEASAELLRLPGRRRRATGSYEVGSGSPDQMPVTQWFTDTVPTVGPDSWQLTVGSRRLQLAELAYEPDPVRAVLDCTGGWYAEQDWHGGRLDRLVGPLAAWAQSLDVVSVTGYRRRFPLLDLDRLMLATHAAGVPLSVGHGGPVRLVAPGRRGFWWVKWVVRVELTSEPPWLQSPFPLQ